MQRIFREIARDAARVTSAPLVQVLVCREGEHGFGATSAALDGAALATHSVRDAIQELLGRDPGHAAAATVLDPFAPAARAVVPCEPGLASLVAIRPAQAAGAASAFFRLAGERGEIVLLRFVLLERPRGAVLRALEAVARLAAARLEAETFRREIAGRNAAYRTFQEAAGEAIFVVDPATGRVLEGNQKLCETTGYDRHELRRLSLPRLLEHPVLDPAALLAKLASARVFRDDEIRLRRRRGPPIPVAVTTARIELPERTVLHVIARDVTRERRALADLRQARDTLAALHLAGAHLTRETDEEGIYAIIARELGRLGFHCGVLARDAECDAFLWRFTSFHPPLQRALGRVLGRPLPQLRLEPAAAPLLRRCLDSGRTVHTDRPRAAAEELLGLRTAAQLRGLVRLVAIRRVILAPLRRDGRIDAVLVVTSSRPRRGDPEAIDALALQASIALDKARLFAALRDERARLETEVERRTRELRHAVEALEETDRRKDNFLANISHELRTPLVTVLGYADLVLSEKLGPLAERQRAALSVVSTSARRLRSFIEELLDFSRHELTGGKLVCAELEVADVMTQAMLALAPRFAERGLDVRARAARGTPRAWGDRERVVQVLVNLLANAERYSPDGSVIRLAAARVGERIEIAVTDRGAGIPAEHLAHIFDRLYQVRDASSPKHKGGALGLGLAIVKSIVEAHGGTVTVRSRVGRGTTFRFSLPRAPRAGAVAAAAGGDAQGGRRAFASAPISRRSAAE